ncbi:MAG: GNAT family N-acetyltransferase [Candidatus Binataceae bacterium]
MGKLAQSHRITGAPKLVTSRLLGRPIALTDFGRLRGIHADPRATATLSTNSLPFSKAHTRKSVESWTRHWDEHGYGVWLFHKRDGEFVGYAGIKVATIADEQGTELLYAIRPEFWGQNYATEMSWAALKFGFESVGIKEIIAFTLTTNVASRRVMEKCGFRYERDIVHAGLPHVLYRLRADEFGEVRDAYRIGREPVFSGRSFEFGEVFKFLVCGRDNSRLLLARAAGAARGRAAVPPLRQPPVGMTPNPFCHPERSGGIGRRLRRAAADTASLPVRVILVTLCSGL